MLTTSMLLLLLTIVGAATASAPSSEVMETHATLVDQAYQSLDHDWDSLKDLYANDATLQFCWGGDEPGCVEGGVDDILLPFHEHEALQTFKVKNRAIAGKNAQVLSLYWSNYMETILGCSQVTTGIIATLEFVQ